MSSLSFLLNIHPQISKGYDLAIELTKQLLTLSMGVVTITITFTKDIVKNTSPKHKIYLSASWCSYFISILFGILHIMGLTGNLLPTDVCCYEHLSSVEVFVDQPTRIFSALQLIFFLIGTLLIIVYGIKGFLKNE